MRIASQRGKTLARALFAAFVTALVLQLLAGTALAEGQFVTYRSLGMLPGSFRSAYQFVVASDSHVGYGPANEKTAAALRDMAQRHPELSFMIHMGDLVETGSDAEYRLMESMTASLPFQVIGTPGNHEARWQDPQASLFRTYFGAPNTSFNHGAWHFVVLDTTYPGQTLGTLDPATLAWLEADLAANPGRPVAVFSHHPLLYGERDFQDSDDAFARIVDKYPVRAVFCGHGHSFVAWRAQGQRFQMVGALMDGAYALVGVDGLAMTVRSVAPGQDGAMEESLLWQATPALVQAGPVLSLAASAEDGRLTAVLELKERAQVSFQIDDGPYNSLGAFEVGIHEVARDVSGHAKGIHTLRVRAVTAGGPFFDSAEFRKDAADLLLWEKELGSAVVGDILCWGTDRVIAGTRDGIVKCIGVGRGETIWEYDAGSPWGGGVLDGSRLYFGTASGDLHCVSAADGTLTWKAGLDKAGFASSPVLAVTPTGRFVVAGSTSGKVYGLNAFSGAKSWQFQAKGAIQSAPAVAGGCLYFGAWDGTLYALEASTGSLIWSAGLGRQVYYSPYLTPAVSNGKVFATTPYDSRVGGSLLCALDAVSGRVLWKVAGRSTFGAPCASPGGEITVTGASGVLYAFSQYDGTLKWQRNGGSTLFVNPPGSGPLYLAGGYRGVVSFLLPEGRADYVVRDSFLFVSPLHIAMPGEDARPVALVADTRGRLSLLAFPR